MTIDEAKYLEKCLEHEILQSLKKFEFATGLTVEHVVVQRAYEVGGASMLVSVDLASVL